MADKTAHGSGVELSAGLELDARRYQWLRDNWKRVITTTEWRGSDVPACVTAIEIGSPLLGRVDAGSLDAAIDAAMSSNASSATDPSHNS